MGSGALFWGFSTFLLLSRVSSASWAEVAQLSKRPAKAFTFFMYGVSLNAFVNILRFVDEGYSQKVYNLHRKVATNEHTHAIVKTTL